MIVEVLWNLQETYSMIQYAVRGILDELVRRTLGDMEDMFGYSFKAFEGIQRMLKGDFG